MSISFQCESCGKKIKAPDNAGGKWGKCPFCNHSCFVPNPESDEDELTLMPVDEEEERMREKMDLEAFQVTQNILNDRAVAEETAEPQTTCSERDILRTIIVYIRQIAAGELNQAEVTLESVMPYKEQAERVVASMIRTDQTEPELADISPRVLLGLLKGLRSKLK